MILLWNAKAEIELLGKNAGLRQSDYRIHPKRMNPLWPYSHDMLGLEVPDIRKPINKLKQNYNKKLT